MGTTVSLAFAETAPAGAVLSVEAAFRALDRRFSLYRADSEASAVARGALAVEDASVKFRDALALALDWQAETDGAFTPFRPDGSIDLAGVIKAQAILEAGEALRMHGAHDWCLNAGGDVLVSGAQAGGLPWVVGIVDPKDRQALLSQFTCSARHPALATSGVAERGDHVWRVDRQLAHDPASLRGPHAGAPRRPDPGTGADPEGDNEAEELCQVTVAAPDIMTADVLATAILAGGRATLQTALSRWNVEVLACTVGGHFLATEAFRDG